MLRGYTGPHRIDGRLLGTLQHRVPPGNFGVRLPDTVGAGRVGVVARFVRPTDVDHNDVARPQFTVRALVVRVGAVRAGPDDDERHFRMPLGHNRFGNVRGDVSLGAARYQELRHPGVYPVDGRARLAQRVDLGGVLDHPQSPQHVGGQHRHHAQHVGQRQQMQRGHRVGDGGGVGVPPACGGGCTAQRVGHQSVRVLAVHPVPNRDTEFGGS